MDRDYWLRFITLFWGQPERAAQCLILELGANADQLTEAEHALHALGKPLPAVVPFILEHWAEQGSELLLESVPRILNPGADDAALNPAARGMRELFPNRCLMLDRTERLAILVDAGGEGDILIAGASNQVPGRGAGWPWSDDGLRQWAYYLPLSLEELARWETGAEGDLSQQMRQMYLRVGGAPQDVEPDFLRPEELKRGILYTGLYHDLMDHISLSPAAVERMRAFVVLHWEMAGNDIGFFADERREDGEYPIYIWNHETTEFEEYADDFAAAIGDFVGIPVAPDDL